MEEAQQVKFNAGIDIAFTISTILKRCEYYARTQDFASWYNELKILERRLYSKAERSKKHKEIFKEIEDASEDKNRVLNLYQKKVMRGKNIPFSVVHQLYSYLAAYEVVLRKYVDMFGYGMPDIESQDKAILQK